VHQDGKVRLPVDNQKLYLGASYDLQIYHDGSNSYLTNTTGELRITDTSIIRVNTDDLRVYKGDGTELTFRAQGDGAVTLFYDNSNKLETTSSGVSVTGNVSPSADNQYDLGASGARWKDLFISNDIDIIDNGKILIGTGDDLKIYHDGSYSRIQNSTGALLLATDSSSIQLNKGTSENMIVATTDGGVSLYFNGANKFSTESTGVTTRNDGDNNVYHRFTTNGGTARGFVYANSGNEIGFLDNSQNWRLRVTAGGGTQSFDHFSPAQNNTYDLGTSSLRWANLYVNDMHFANSPENVNKVDGTWGDWTLQEGEDTIYMLNNRNGKKYKMALQEVN
jgi:hypothetical protein